MRYVIIALLLFSLPVLVSLLRGHPHRRPWAFAALGFLFFLSDQYQGNGWIVGWPIWKGYVRGMAVSPADMLALALLITRRPMPGMLPFWGIFALYGAILATSLLPADIPAATLFAVWQYGRILLLFAAIGSECHRPEMRAGLLAGLSLGLMLQAGVVIQQKLGGMVQAPGTMAHQNILGMMTGLALLPLVAGVLAGDRRWLPRLGIAAALIIMAGGGSRATVGIVGGGMVLLTLLSLARRVTPLKLKLVGAGAAALAIATPLALMTLKDRFGSVSLTATEQQRPAFERAARAMAADHPFGVGANLFVIHSNRDGYAARAGVAWNASNRGISVHNAYLLARAETGWLGEIAFILILAVPMLSGLIFAFRRREGSSGEIALGSAMALAINMVHNNFEYAIFTYNVFGLAVLNIGLIAAQVRAARHVAMPRRVTLGRSRPHLAAAGPAAE